MPAPTYATGAQLLAFLGQERAQLILGAGLTRGRADLTAVADQSVLIGSGLMNEVFDRSSYLIPIDPSLITDTGIAAQLAAILQQRCCEISMASSAAGVADLPEGTHRAIEMAAAWLDAILDGSENLLGVDRVGTEIQKQVAGRIGFVPNPEDSSQEIARIFRRWGHLEGSLGYLSFGGWD